MALSVFDRIVSDGGFNHDQIDKKTSDFMLELLKPSSALLIDDYLKDVIKSYIRRKKKITILMLGLRHIWKAIPDLMIKDDIKVINTANAWDPSKSSQQSNLLSPNIFAILPHVTDIVIKTSGFEHDENAYAFNIFYFLEYMTQVSTWKNIKIEQMMKGKEKENKSWLCKVWNSEAKQRLIDQCEKYKLKIYFDKKTEKLKEHMFFESFIIERQFE